MHLHCRRQCLDRRVADPRAGLAQNGCGFALDVAAAPGRTAIFQSRQHLGGPRPRALFDTGQRSHVAASSAAHIAGSDAEDVGGSYQPALSLGANSSDHSRGVP